MRSNSMDRIPVDLFLNSKLEENNLYLSKKIQICVTRSKTPDLHQPPYLNTTCCLGILLPFSLKTLRSPGQCHSNITTHKTSLMMHNKILSDAGRRPPNRRLLTGLIAERETTITAPLSAERKRSQAACKSLLDAPAPRYLPPRRVSGAKKVLIIEMNPFCRIRRRSVSALGLAVGG